LNRSNLVPNVFFRRQLGKYLADDEKARVLLTAHQIPHSVLTTDEYTESIKLASLANTVWRSANDESSGGAYKKLPFGFFKMLCHAGSNCKNLQSLIYRSCEFCRLMGEELQFSIEVKGEEAILIMDQKLPCETSLPTNHDYFIMTLSTVLIRWFSWMIGEPIKLDRVEFSFPMFALLDDFEEIYSCAVKFEHRANHIVFSNGFLNKPVIASIEKLPSLLINAPHCFLSHYRQLQTVAEQVRKILAESSEFTQLKLVDIALQLNFSSATLTRKLKAENISFMEIKDRLRKHKAMSLLRTTDLSVTSISYSLGFSEASSFTRAFKKWTGDSPNEYRIQVG